MGCVELVLQTIKFTCFSFNPNRPCLPGQATQKPFLMAWQLTEQQLEIWRTNLTSSSFILRDDICPICTGICNNFEYNVIHLLIRKLLCSLIAIVINSSRFREGRRRKPWKRCSEIFIYLIVFASLEKLQLTPQVQNLLLK